MRNSTRLSMALAIAVIITLPTLGAITTQAGIGLVGTVQLLTMAGLAAVLRRFRVADALVNLAQCGALAVWLWVWSLVMMPREDGDSLFTAMSVLYTSGIEHIQSQSAPMEANAGAAWLLLALIGCILIVTDLLSVTLAQPAWSLAPLMTLYLIPALGVPDDLKWWDFVLLAAAYALVLAVSNADAAAGLSETPRRSGGRFLLTILIVGPAVVASLVVGALLPRGQAMDWMKQGGQAGPLQLADPTVDLSENLRRPANSHVLNYRTEKGSGVYLRLTSLPVLDEQGAKLTAVQLAASPLATVPGREGANDTPQSIRVEVGDFGSEFLPAPYAPRSVEAPGSWAWDPVSLTIISTGSDRASATRGLSYSVTSEVIDPTPSLIATASAGTPPDAAITAQVPAGVPDRITRLTREITANADTAGLKAAAIQAYLRDPKQFRYSTEAPPGDGFDVLDSFLFETREGYCIHYATSMALMARIAGIPSRVAVGFLPGTQVSDGYEVKSHDMHAWPELYFQSLGWVRFEPTAGAASAPNWTTPTGDDRAPTSSPEPTVEPTQPTVEPTQESAQPTVQPQTPEEAASGSAALAIAARVLGVALLVGLVVAAPLGVRTLLRRRRLAPQDDPVAAANGAWDELRATVLDHRDRWPGGSPRQVCAQLAERYPDASADIERLGLSVERAWYAAEPPVGDDLAGRVSRAASAIDGASDRRTHWLALLAPRSLWSDWRSLRGERSRRDAHEEQGH